MTRRVQNFNSCESSDYNLHFIGRDLRCRSERTIPFRFPSELTHEKKQIARTTFSVLSLAQPPRRQLSTLPLFRVCSPAQNSEFRPRYLLQDTHKCTHFQCFHLHISCEGALPPSNLCVNYLPEMAASNFLYGAVAL